MIATSLWKPPLGRLTFGLALTVVATAFEALAVATVLPETSADLGGLAWYGWTFSAFMLANLVGTSLGGGETDRRGPTLPFVVGTVLFASGLVVSGIAPSMPVIVAGRAAQGLGAGLLSSVSYASIARAYPVALQPRMLAVLSSAWVIPGLIGPGLASAIAAYAGWRWVFLALAPLPFVAAALVVPALRALPKHTTHSDSAKYGSALALAIGVTALLAALRAPSWPVALGLALAGFTLAARGFPPLMPPGTLVARAGLPAAVACMALINAAFFGTEAYVPLALSRVRQQPILLTGLALTAASLTWTVGAWLPLRLTPRFGRSAVVQGGLTVLLLGIAGTLSLLSASVPAWCAVVAWAVTGFGMGLSFTASMAAVLEGRAAWPRRSHLGVFAARAGPRGGRVHGYRGCPGRGAVCGGPAGARYRSGGCADDRRDGAGHRGGARAPCRGWHRRTASGDVGHAPSRTRAGPCRTGESTRCRTGPSCRSLGTSGSSLTGNARGIRDEDGEQTCLVDVCRPQLSRKRVVAADHVPLPMASVDLTFLPRRPRRCRARLDTASSPPHAAARSRAENGTWTSYLAVRTVADRAPRGAHAPARLPWHQRSLVPGKKSPRTPTSPLPFKAPPHAEKPQPPRIFTYVDAVARHGSIRKAAEALHVVSSALNQRILDLEQELGSALFERLPRGVRPTAAGELYLAYVRRSLRDLEAVGAQIERLRGLGRGQVRIAVAESVTGRLLPDAIAQFQTEHPGVSFHVWVDGPKGLRDALVDDTADLILTHELAEHPEVSTIATRHQPLCALVAPDHPLATRTSLKLHECLPFPIALPDDTLAARALIDRALLRASFKFEPALVSNSVELTKTFARWNRAVCFQFQIGGMLDPSGMVAIPLVDPAFAHAQLMLAARRTRVLPVPAAAFAQQLADLLETLSLDM